MHKEEENFSKFVTHVYFDVKINLEIDEKIGMTGSQHKGPPKKYDPLLGIESRRNDICYKNLVGDKMQSLVIC